MTKSTMKNLLNLQPADLAEDQFGQQPVDQIARTAILM
jgi:hypothetical protein